MDSFVSKMMGQDTPPPQPAPQPLPTKRRSPAAQTGKQPQVVSVLNRQRGTTTGARSQRYHALPPGTRISKTGRPYSETRKNRSYLPGR